MEGVDILKLGATSMANALGLLVACFYVFNMAYPANSGNVYYFCEATLLDMTNEANKRVYEPMPLQN